ncbi:MAG: tRNA lysidine(34) synthetase TilS [Spirochaetales bacterium]|nr:tRNA lysidine(34) synthetase TilS [Spirochaetales bacterium]
MKLINAVSDFLTAHHIQNCSVLIAVSGGRDSMALFHCLYSIKDKFHLSLSAAYVNHHIRADSDDEEAFVTKTVSAFENVPLYKHIIDRSYWLDHTQSVEETARRIRYDFFRRTAAEHHIDYIATAHHFDDRIETFFINLLRGGGVETLVSIPAVSSNIIRPLLNISRSEIDCYIRDNNIPYIDDSTNSGDAYLRNRIRHHLVPVLSDLSDHYRQSFAHVFDFLTENVAAVDCLTDQALSCVTYTDDHNAIINRKAFSGYPVAVRKNVIKRIIADLHYPCAISLPLLEALTSDGRIVYQSSHLSAHSKNGKLYIKNELS